MKSNATPPAPPSAYVPAGPPGRVAILVVDDEPTIRRALTRLFQLEGYDVDTASDGVMALEKLTERPYDLMVCDLRMPGLDGLGLYHELERRHPELTRRIIFLTGFWFDEETTELAEKTGAPYLCKPWHLPELQRVLARILTFGFPGNVREPVSRSLQGPSDASQPTSEK